MRIYVTGASGVLGSTFIDWFNHRAEADQPIPALPVIAVSRHPCPTLAASDPQQRLVDTIFDARWLDDDTTNATILHCAGLSSPRAAFGNFADTAREHILPHVDMVEAMLARGWRGRLVFFSSGGTIYGDALKQPISETYPPSPVGFYGLHKLCLERAFEQLARERGFELVILRVSNPYGSLLSKPGQGVIPILINAFLNNETFRIIGDGQAARDYLEMQDLCEAVERVVGLTMTTPSLTLNIGSGQATSLNELISLLATETGRKLQTTQIAPTDEVRSNVLDCTRASIVLDWRAKVPLLRGLKSLLEKMDV